MLLGRQSWGPGLDSLTPQPGLSYSLPGWRTRQDPRHDLEQRTACNSELCWSGCVWPEMPHLVGQGRGDLYLALGQMWRGWVVYCCWLWLRRPQKKKGRSQGSITLSCLWRWTGPDLASDVSEHCILDNSVEKGGVWVVEEAFLRTP